MQSYILIELNVLQFSFIESMNYKQMHAIGEDNSLYILEMPKLPNDVQINSK